jgi:transcriptional regulator with XRE-family HTH domain
MNGLGAYVARRREQLGLTQQELAERVGVRRDTIAQIETRTKLPGADVRRRLAAALGVRHVDLLIAAGELSPEEIAGTPGRWPTDDPIRQRAYELIEQMPEDILSEIVIRFLEMALLAARQRAPQPAEREPLPLAPWPAETSLVAFHARALTGRPRPQGEGEGGE